MKQITAYECPYCWDLFKVDWQEHEEKCRAKFEQRQRESEAYDRKIEEATTKAIEAAKKRTDLIRVIYAEDSGQSLRDYIWNCVYADANPWFEPSCSIACEDITTKMIQAVIPEYKYR